MNDLMAGGVYDFLYEKGDKIGEYISQFFATSLEYHNIKLLIDDNFKNIAFEGRPSRIYPAIINIVNNAIAYANDAKKKIRVTFEFADSNITVSIWNNGSKFSDDVLENFGKLFYREDTSRNSQFEHFGIGLAFVKQVMSIHSGDIQLHNKENGAMVKLIIPIKSSDYA